MKKKLIDKLLRYNFNRKQRRFLFKQGYINGCGGKGGFSFSDTIRAAIKSLDGFNKRYYGLLLDDIEKLCGEHDIDYTLGHTKKDFRLANFRFAWRVFRLLNWNTLTCKNGIKEIKGILKFTYKFKNFFGRLSIGIIIYVLLNRYGEQYFNFGHKKELKDLFVNFPGNTSNFNL